MTRSLPWLAKQKREISPSRKKRATVKHSFISHIGAATYASSIQRCVKETHQSSTINPTPSVQGNGLDENSSSHDLSRHSLMHDGFDADDKWRMVEDELLDTAKTFTQSLRQAEYEKLMRDVADRKSSGTYNISRPIINTSQTVGGAKGIHAQEQKKTLKRKSTQRDFAKDSDDDDDTPWMRDDCLADLMTNCNTNVTELMDIPDAGLPDNPSVVSRMNDFSSNDNNTHEVCNKDQDPGSDENDDLDYSPTTYPIHSIEKKPDSNNDNNNNVQPNHTTDHQEKTTSVTQTMSMVTSEGYPYKDKLGKSTTKIARNRFQPLVVPDDDCAKIKNVPNTDQGTHRRKRKILSLKSNAKESDKKHYNAKSVSLYEIPTFLV